MLKLLNTYRENPTLKKAQQIRAYARKHPFAAVFLLVGDADLLADAIHHANKGGK